MEKVASYLTPLVEERLRQSNQGGMDQSVSIPTRSTTGYRPVNSLEV